MGQEEFYTLKGYNLLEHNNITSSMEDYLEMIFRMSKDSAVVRISALAAALHVAPSSASKMAANLRERELIDFPRYGYITLTEAGRKTGNYLMLRHELLNQLLTRINGESDLREVERIEHFVSPRTIKNLEAFLEKLPDI